MKLLTLIFIFGSILVFSGCGRAVAMNMYNANVESVKISGIKGQITPQVIEDVKKRRERYIRLHGSI